MVVPERVHNKSRVFETKDSVIKDVLVKMLRDKVSLKMSTRKMVHLAAFASNIVHGRGLLSSYELATGCMPDPERSEMSVLSVEVLERYQAREQGRISARMEKALRSKHKPSESFCTRCTERGEC